VAKRKRKTPLLPILAAVVATALLSIGGMYAWDWVSHVRVSAVHVSGTVFASEDEILRHAAIDTSTSLLRVRPDSVGQRVSVHAWVRDVSVRRWPTGRVDIRVTEREPVLLVLDGRGEPTAYIDEEGYVMPVTAGAVFDVPVLRGDLPRMLAGASLTDGPLLAMAAALPRVAREVSALVSEIERRDGELWVRTLPAAEVGVLNVRLGREGFESRMKRLHSFWHQAVLPRPDRRYAVVDLRFDSQIITRESVITR
jgi:cell division protein FtsQ